MKKISDVEIERMKLESWLNRIPFSLVDSCDPLECRPCVIVCGLYDAGKLPRWSERYYQWQHLSSGMCHDLARAMMIDLVFAGASYGWTCVTARLEIDAGRIINHTWLEYGGWVVNTRFNLCRYTPTEWYWRNNIVIEEVIMTPRETIRIAQKGKPFTDLLIGKT